MKWCSLVLLCVLVLLSSGCERKSKEQMFQEGLALKEQQNFSGATVLFRNALDKDPNFFEARYQLGLIFLETGQYVRAERELEKVLLQNPGNREVLLALADARLRNDQTEQAVSMLEDYLRGDPENPRALELLGRGMALQGNLQRAEELFKKALSLNASYRGARNGLARLYAASRRHDEARNLLAESIEKDPKNYEAHVLLMQLEGALGNPENAIAAGQKLLEEFPGDLQTLYLLGILWLNQGDIEAAAQSADELNSLHSGHPAGQRLQGLILYARQDYGAAAEKLQQSLRQMPDNSGRYFLGMAHFRQEQYEMALGQFQSVLDNNPGHGQARLMVAQTLLRQQRYEDSRMAAELLLVAEPDNAQARDVLGSIYLAQGDFDRGMSEIDRAVALNPNLVEAQLKRGLFHLHQGDLDQAELSLSEAVRQAPDLLNSRLLLAASHLRRQNFAGAIATLEEGLTGQVGDALLYNYMAAAHLGQGNTEAALAALEKAKQRKPDYLSPYVNLANHYLTRGEPERAAAEYKAYLKLEPDNLRALISLATLQELQGDKAAAEKILRRAAETGDAEGSVATTLFLGRHNRLDEALKVVRAGLARHPRNPALLELEGKVLFRQQQIGPALESFRRLAEVRPVEGLPILIAGLMQTGQPEEAEKVARAHIRNHPDNSQGYVLMAEIHKQRGQHDQGHQVLRQGQTRMPADPVLSMARASLYLAEDRTDEAKAIYVALRRSHPEYLPAVFSLAALYDRLGDKRQALTLYRQSLELDGDYMPALNNLAYLLAENYGDLEEALRMARQALRKSPSDARIMDTVGYVLVRQQRYDEALPFLKQASQMLPEEPLVLMHLGKAYLGLGQQAEARSALDKALIHSGEPGQAERVRSLLRQLDGPG